MFRLDGKRVIIVGGSAGMGRSTAELALACGAGVVIAARADQALASMRKENHG